MPNFSALRSRLCESYGIKAVQQMLMKLTSVTFSLKTFNCRAQNRPTLIYFKQNAESDNLKGQCFVNVNQTLNYSKQSINYNIQLRINACVHISQP